MQIVIDINEEDKQHIDKCLKGEGLAFFENGQLIKRIILAVFYGKVLPKGHGRLIDADVLADGFEDNFEFCEVVNATPTIIEADRSEEE